MQNIKKNKGETIWRHEKIFEKSLEAEKGKKSHSVEKKVERGNPSALQYSKSSSVGEMFERNMGLLGGGIRNMVLTY